MASAPLNVFQRLIRQWDSIHPYNAAQIMLLRDPCEPERVEATWRQTVAELGVGPNPVQVHRHLAEHPVVLASQVVQTPDPATVTLEAYVSAELNRPFDPSGDAPFRPFALSDTSHADGRFYAGVVYQHWVADSVSIRTLLREWCLRMYEPELRARRSPLIVAQRGYWHRFGPWRSDWPLLPTLLATLAWGAKLRKVRRIERPDYADPKTRFAVHSLPAGIVPSLLEYSRSRGVTMNDVFLAAIARVCDRYVAAPPTPRRHDLALGTIVDLRAGSAKVSADEFGLFLGFTGVIIRRADLRDWEQLVRSIAQQNARHKRMQSADASQIRMAGALVAGRLLRRDKLLNWYRKRFPLSAGISNINLNRTWVGEHHPGRMIDYIRVSPVGPFMPLVFTPSTLGDDLHIGFTYRESVVSPELAGTIADEFSAQLTTLARRTP